ncbi:hypothetical protein K491DRAFT_486581 [Lophiostoma macrostomum CBS 122681]|uniref:Uncharacterized protein n=1 Tax=Lophiostoma macrostomum CBS 122681 TaxID=1314788 RepID=A0A6A6T4M3_9PLEO|nr:hypothetical protein K491DRAFT_486581 [Lophiostoma macrostomum CBS 122681]
MTSRFSKMSSTFKGDSLMWKRLSEKAITRDVIVRETAMGFHSAGLSRGHVRQLASGSRVMIHDRFSKHITSRRRVANDKEVQVIRCSCRYLRHANSYVGSHQSIPSNDRARIRRSRSLDLETSSIEMARGNDLTLFTALCSESLASSIWCSAYGIQRPIIGAHNVSRG